MSYYSKQITVLYVEDEKEVREAFSRTLARYTKKLIVATDGVEGLKLYKEHLPDIVISDIKMPNKDGLELAKDILEINPEQIIMFTTAHTESKYTLQALEMQVEAYLIKPINKNRFKIKLEHISKNIINNRKILKNYKVIEAIFNEQSNISVLTDFEKIEFASKSFLELFDLNSLDDFSEHYESFIDIFADKKSIKCEEGYCNCVFSKDADLFIKQYYEIDEPVVCLKCNDNIYKIHITPIKVENETLYSISMVDITVMHTQKMSALHDAFHDKLTSLYNRLMFDKLLDKEYQRFLRYKRPLSLAIFDIDHFKNINDTFGHLVGDDILKVLATFFIENIRETDIIARWGGEEFVLLMSETSLKEAYRVCDKLRENIKSLNLPLIPKFTISVGVSVIEVADTKEKFFKKADIALYSAKNSGRDRVCVYEKDIK